MRARLTVVFPTCCLVAATKIGRWVRPVVGSVDQYFEGLTGGKVVSTTLDDDDDDDDEVAVELVDDTDRNGCRETDVILWNANLDRIDREIILEEIRGVMIIDGLLDGYLFTRFQLVLLNTIQVSNVNDGDE